MAEKGYRVISPYDGKASRDHYIAVGYYLSDSPALWGCGDHLVQKGKAIEVTLSDADADSIRNGEGRKKATIPPDPSIDPDEPGSLRTQKLPPGEETFHGLGLPAEGQDAPRANVNPDFEDDEWDGKTDPLAHNPNPANVVGQGNRRRHTVVVDQDGELHPNLERVESEGEDLPEPHTGLHRNLDGSTDADDSDELHPDRGVATQEPNPAEHPDKVDGEATGKNAITGSEAKDNLPPKAKPLAKRRPAATPRKK